jgi:hypothetical protein
MARGLFAGGLGWYRKERSADFFFSPSRTVESSRWEEFRVVLEKGYAWHKGRYNDDI